MVTTEHLYVMVLSYNTRTAIGPFSRNTHEEHGPIGPDRFVVMTLKRAKDTASEWDRLYGTPDKKAVIMSLADFQIGRAHV